MKLRLLDLIVCPECSGTLALARCEHEELMPDMATHREVMEGLLRCNKCNRVFPIINGIPRLLPDELRPSLVEHHAEYFARYPELCPNNSADKSAGDNFVREKRKTYGSFSFQRMALQPPTVDYAEDWLAHFDRRIKPLTGPDLSGKLGLDAGCGFGRHLYCASSYGAEVVGIDLSEGVERAFQANRGNPRVHIVQGDIYRMPFRPGTFDFGMSIGVLHHLPDPRRGFESIVRAVHAAGNVLIWVYGYNGMRWTYRVSHLRTLRRITTKLPRPVQRAICVAVAALLNVVLWWPSRLLRLFKLTRGIAERLPAQNNTYQPFAMKVTAVFDRLGTPTTHFHDRNELLEWYRSAGLEDVKVFTEDRRGWQAFGKKASFAISAAPAS